MVSALWKVFSEGEWHNPHSKATLDKDLVIWEKKDNKAYALIIVFVSEEVNHHIIPIKNAYDALNKLKYLYDTLRIRSS